MGGILAAMFKRKPAPSPEVEPFDSWEITTVMPSDDSRMQLRGHVFGDRDPAESLRYVEAIAIGLRQAGFPAEVNIVRESRTRR